MKKLNLIYAVVLVVLVAVFASAQDLESVIAKSANAMGGWDKLQSIESMQMKMSGTMQGSMTVEMMMYTKKPGKFRMEMSMMGQNMTTVSDGTSTWMEMMGRTMDMPQDKAQNNQMMAQNFGEALLKLKEMGAKYVGREDFNGNQCDVISYQPEGATDTAFMYFNANTGLIDGMKTQAQGQNIDMLIQEYQSFDGLMMPTKMIVNANGQQMMDMTISDVKVNPALDDTMFMRK